jgi:hypothetical protein
MPSPGGICCHIPPLAASLRRHEIHGSQAAQVASTGEISAEAFACRGRTRQGHAQRACCAVRRTLRCDGKLLSPERRCAAKRTSRCDRAVVVLQDRFRACQRRACRLAGHNRSTQRRPVPVADIEEHKLREQIRELARHHIRWGRRLVYRRLRIEGWSVNHKRVQRIWREEGLHRAPATQAEALTTGRRFKRATQSRIPASCLGRTNIVACVLPFVLAGVVRLRM